MMLPNEAHGEGVELGLACAITAGVATGHADKVPDVKKHDDQVVEGRESAPLHGEATITVCGEAALDLNAGLPAIDTRIGVDANQIVPLVVGRRLVGEDVSTHELA